MTEKRDRNGTVNQPPQLSYPFPYNYPCDDDEIDLYEIWIILKRRKKIIFLTLIVFLFGALLYLLITKPKYRTTVVYQPVSTINVSTNSTSNILTPLISTDILAQAVNNLNTALQQENYDFLAKNLNLPLSAVEEIVSVSAQYDKKPLSKALKVVIDTNNKNLIPILSSKLESYLNKLPAVQNAIKGLKQYLITKIKIDEAQIIELTNLKKELLKELSLAKDTTFKNLILNKIFNINTKILNKKAEIEFAKLQLNQLKGVELAVPPLLPNKPYSPQKGLVIGIAIFVGLISGIFLALFIEWLENAKKEYEQKKNEKF